MLYVNTYLYNTGTILFFLLGSGRKNVVFGPTVGHLALFAGPCNTFHAVVAWAKTQATVTTKEVWFLTLTKHCFCHYTVHNINISLSYITGNWIQRKFEIGPTKISMGPYLRLKRCFGPSKRKFTDHWFKATADAADKGKLYSVCNTSLLSERSFAMVLQWSLHHH